MSASGTGKRRPRGVKGEDFSYEKGFILESQEDMNTEYKSLVSYSLPELRWKIMEKVAIFTCACLNADIQGTIYFGVANGKEKNSQYQHGEILGLHVEDIRDDIINAFQWVLDNHIRSEEGPLKKGGDQSCFNIEFVPVKIQGTRSELYIVEIEVARDWDFCKDNIYFTREWKEKTLRQGGGEENRAKKALHYFYKMKEDQWNRLLYVRVNGATKFLKPMEVKASVMDPLRVKYKRWMKQNQDECSIPAMGQDSMTDNSKDSDHASAQPGIRSADESEQSVGNDGKTLLHAAAKRGDVNRLSELLFLGFEINSRNSNGETPVMTTARFRRLNAFNFLVGSGVDLKLEESKGFTVLHWAAFGGHGKIIEKLLSLGFDINPRDSDGVTPLMVAAGIGQLNACNLLLQGGARSNLKDNSGWTVLHHAVLGENVEIIEKLLSYGLDINAKNNNNDTLLMIAKSEGKDEAVKYLISKGAR